MFTVDILRTDIRAALYFAAVDDTRCYLNGVCFECGPDGARMVATNGHILGVCNILPAARWAQNCAEHGAPAATECGIVPRDVLVKIKRARRGESPLIGVTIDPAAGAYTVDDFSGAKFSGRLIDGKYPDWRHVLPAAVSGETAHFQPHLTMAVQDAAQERAGKEKAHIRIRHNGRDGPSWCDVGDDFIAAIMPMRGLEPDEARQGAPDWARAYLGGADVERAD